MQSKKKKDFIHSSELLQPANKIFRPTSADSAPFAHLLLQTSLLLPFISYYILLNINF